MATATQCHVYNTTNLNTPHIFDLKDTVTLLMQVGPPPPSTRTCVPADAVLQRWKAMMNRGAVRGEC